MNTLLAGTLGFINTFLAVVLIVAGTALGATGGLGLGASPIGAIAGFAAGLMSAALFCGFFAVLLDIRYQLIKLNANNIASRPKTEPTLA